MALIPYLALLLQQAVLVGKQVVELTEEMVEAGLVVAVLMDPQQEQVVLGILQAHLPHREITVEMVLLIQQQIGVQVVAVAHLLLVVTALVHKEALVEMERHLAYLEYP
jgi:hypothetical protein